MEPQIAALVLVDLEHPATRTLRDPLRSLVFTVADTTPGAIMWPGSCRNLRLTIR